MIGTGKRRPLLHEWVFGFFLAVIWLRFCAALGPLSEPALTYLGAIAMSLLAYRLARAKQKLWAWHLGFVWYTLAMTLLFQHMRGRFPLIAGPPVDGHLLAIDRLLFGKTPAVFLQAFQSPLATEVLSACYFLFFFYLYGAILYRIFGTPLRVAKIFFAGLFTVYGIGFLGYSLVPALGPYLAEPQLFSRPLVGSFAYRLVSWTVAQGTNGVDVFPSLHTAVTLYILLFDAIWSRRLFWIALAPAIGLVIATMYLRFHYGIDVIAGAALALTVHAFLRWLYPRQSSARIIEGVSPA